MERKGKKPIREKNIFILKKTHTQKQISQQNKTTEEKKKRKKKKKGYAIGFEP